MGNVILNVDPRALRLPPSRLIGADPIKLARQLSRFGLSMRGMPPLEVIRGRDGELQIINGVTRATRVARFLPGRSILVEIVEDRPGRNLSMYPTVGERLP